MNIIFLHVMKTMAVSLCALPIKKNNFKSMLLACMFCFILKTQGLRFTKNLRQGIIIINILE